MQPPSSSCLGNCPPRERCITTTSTRSTCSNADQPRGQQAESDSFIIPIPAASHPGKRPSPDSRRQIPVSTTTALSKTDFNHASGLHSLQEHGETGLPTALSGQMTAVTFPSRPPGTPCSWSGAALPRRFGISGRLPGRLCPGTWAASNGPGSLCYPDHHSCRCSCVS